MIKKRTITIFTFFLLTLVMLSCKKDDNNQSEIDHNLIVAYASANQLNGEFTPSGLYYEIIEPGSANHPTINSQVTVSYVGYGLDGVVFDDGDFVTFYLNKVIVGWQEGIQLIGEGGKIKLVIPSALAYGSNGTNGIAPDKVLVFDVTLKYFLD